MPLSPDLREKKVCFLGHDYGYGDELMYYGEIFKHFQEIFPETRIAIDRHRRVRNPYGLRLWPLARYWRRPIERQVEGVGYRSEFVVPSPMLIFRLVHWQPHVVFFIEFTPVALLGLVASLLMPRGRRILLIESDPRARGGVTAGIVLRVKRLACHFVHLVHTNTEGGRAYLIDVLGCDPRKVLVAPYLTSRPPGTTDQPPTALAEDSRVEALFVNSITRRKGAHILVEALRRCRPETRSHLHVTVVGDGEELANLVHTAEDPLLTGVLTFVGRKRYTELGPYYSGRDILVSPTFADYRSLASFEGLGYGLALLISRQDGAALETVLENENGFRFDPYDPQELADRLDLLVADRHLLARFKARSLALYRERFSIELAAANLAHSAARALTATNAGEPA